MLTQSNADNRQIVKKRIQWFREVLKKIIHLGNAATKEITMDPVTGAPEPFSLLPLLILAPLIVLPYWKITQKAGYSGWLSLLILIPLINLIFLYWLAFAKWPISRN